MRKIIILMLLLIPFQAFADMDLYFDESKNPILTKQEQEALKLIEKWAAGDKVNAPLTTGSDGSIQFIYGISQPSIICAVLQVTDIELEPGEQVYGLHLGDSVRWSVEPAITGSYRGDIMHLIVKPKDVGLETSLIVTTDRRTYHIRLRSHKTSYMPRVSFSYPDQMLAKWGNIQRTAKQEYEEKIMPETKEYLGDLDFDYYVSGATKFKPIRVYSDGIKTIIQMPKEMIHEEAPSLLVELNGKEIMVNYRLQGDRYIVDQVFDKAILIAGVGSKQDKVIIERGKARKAPVFDGSK